MREGGGGLWNVSRDTLAQSPTDYFKSVGKIANFANNLTYRLSLQSTRKVKPNFTENIKGIKSLPCQSPPPVDEIQIS